MKALLVLSSNTGNTRTFADYFLKESSFDIVIDDKFSSNPKEYDHLILGSFTWANGRIPARMKKYLIKNQDLLKGKKVFIFGSGLSIYPKFCGAVDGMEKICIDCGAEVVSTYKFEQRFDEDEISEKELESIKDKIVDWEQF